MLSQHLQAHPQMFPFAYILENTLNSPKYSALWAYDPSLTIDCQFWHLCDSRPKGLTPGVCCGVQEQGTVFRCLSAANNTSSPEHGHLYASCTTSFRSLMRYSGFTCALLRTSISQESSHVHECSQERHDTHTLPMFRLLLRRESCTKHKPANHANWGQ